MESLESLRAESSANGLEIILGYPHSVIDLNSVNDYGGKLEMASEWQYFHESCPVCGGNVATKSNVPFVVNVGDMAMCQTCSLIGAIELDPNDQDSVFVSWDLDDVYQEAKIIGYNDLNGKNHFNFYSGDPLVRKALVEGYEAGKEHRSEHEHAIATDHSIEY